MKVKKIYKATKSYDGYSEAIQSSYCFDSLIGWPYDCKNIDTVIYYAVKRTGNNETEFWLNFIKTFLKDLKWKATIEKKRVVYELKLSHRRAPDLFYLTAFRYIEKFPEIVKILYKRGKKLKAENKFKLFQKIHVEVMHNKKMYWIKNALCNYGLIYPAKYDEEWDIKTASSLTPLPMKKVLDNLMIKRKALIHYCFR